MSTKKSHRKPQRLPQNPQQRFVQAQQYHQAGQWIHALALYLGIPAKDAHYAQAMRCAASLVHDAGDHPQALELIARAIALEPFNAPLYNERGLYLQALGQHAQALSSFNAAIAIDPDCVNAWINCALVHLEMRQLDAALRCCDQAILLAPQNVAAHVNRGVILKELGQWEAALGCCEHALALDANQPAAWQNQGVLLKLLNQLEAAMTSFERVLSLAPDNAEAHFCKAEILLLQGALLAGWREFEWRWRYSKGPRRRYPEQTHWQGREDLSGKTILLHAEQGLGDTLQFCRYVSKVVAQGARVILEVPPQLSVICQSLAGVDQWLEWGAPPPAFDYHCPLMSLPLAFQTELKSIPADIPYLYAAPEKVARWRARLGKKQRPRIGLVWSGGTRPDRPDLIAINERRNLPFALLARLKAVDADFYSLQKGEPAESELPAQRAQHWPEDNFQSVADALLDFADTAALLENLDLLISVDTSTAHLAGALGKPVWVLNRRDSCWRWLLERSDSPWYPTARLYRQTAEGGWPELLERVNTDLQAWVTDWQASALAGVHGGSDEAPSDFVGSVPQHDASGEAQALFAQAKARHDAGELAQAQALYMQIPPDSPLYPQARSRLAVIACQCGQLASALALVSQALELEPLCAAFHSERGAYQMLLGQQAAAFASFELALAIDPESADTWNNRGQLLLQMQQHAAAQTCFARSADCRQRQIAKLDAQIERYTQEKQYELLLDCCAQRIALVPDDASAYSQRASALIALNRLDEALVECRLASEKAPEQAVVWYNLGLVHQRLNHFAIALDCLERAMMLDPDNADVHTLKGEVCLHQGKFEPGWREYEWRWRCETGPDRRAFTQPLWLGDAALAGKSILIHAEQGLGDTLQFCRYIPMLAARGASVVFEVQKPVYNLLLGLEGVAQLVPNNLPPPPCDYHCPLLSLPLAFQTTLASIPAEIPYLQASAAKVQRWRERLGEKKRLRVGLVWCGGRHELRPDLLKRRDLSFQQIARLKLPEMDFYSLQKGKEAEAELVACRALYWPEENFHDLTHALVDFSDTAALVANLDLVVTVDTSTAHLAGALGKPVWILNRFDSCWRWLADRNDSPWYPTARLYRQTVPGEWSDVLERVRVDLMALAGVACPVCQSACQWLDSMDCNRACLLELPPSGVMVSYWRCSSCGFCFTPEICAWSESEFSRSIYNEEYVRLDPDALELRPRNHADFLDACFGNEKVQIRHLDYGGGEGMLAGILQAAGWNSTSWDPFFNRQQTLEDLGQFNLISAFEVFEHVPDVNRLMAQLDRLLSDSGMIVFSTLLSDGNIRAGEKIDWWYVGPRNGHISLFSQASLRRLGERFGFILESHSENLHVFRRMHVHEG